MAAQTKLPEWIFHCLDQYGNCACGRAIVKKYGKEKFLDLLESLGYPCELEILAEQKDTNALPKDGTYIITLKNHNTLYEMEEEEAE